MKQLWLLLALLTLAPAAARAQQHGILVACDTEAQIIDFTKALGAGVEVEAALAQVNAAAGDDTACGRADWIFIAGDDGVEFADATGLTWRTRQITVLGVMVPGRGQVATNPLAQWTAWHQRSLGI